MSQEMNTNKTTTAGQAAPHPSSGQPRHNHPDPNHHQQQQQQQPHVYQCQQCDWTSGYSYNVRRHCRKEHWGQLKFACDLCPAVLSWGKKALRNHMARTHREREVGCDLCAYRGHSEEIVYRHKVAVHQKRYNPARVECWMCGHYYASKAGLDRHILRVHAGVKAPRPAVSEGSWPCGLCPRSFGQKRNLNRHMRNYHHAH